MSQVLFKAGLAAEYAALTTKVDDNFYFLTDSKELYIGSKKITNAADLEAALARIDGDEETLGSIRNVVAGYIDGLDVNEFVLASKDANNVITIKGIKETDGKIAAGTTTANDVTFAPVAATGAAADVSVADSGDKLTATTVEDALAELADAVATATAAGDVTCETSEPVSGDILRTYSFYQGVLSGDDAAAKAAKKIIDVNVPRDYLVKSAEVKTVSTADDPYTGAAVGDKYIDFVINTKDSAGTATHLYLPVNDLVDVYTGSTGAEVTVTVGNDNSISASINKIAATKVIYRAADTTDPENPIAEQTVKQKIDAIDATIAAMDADLDASGTAAHSGTFVVSGVTQADGVITGIDSVEVEAAGAAATAKSEVIGTGTGRSGSGTEQDPYVYDDTIKGVKTMIEDKAAEAASSVDDLDVSEFALASKSGNTVTIKGIKETDGKIAVGTDTTKDVTLADVAASGAAADVAIADAGNYTSQTSVEGALQEIYQNLTWQSIS